MLCKVDTQCLVLKFGGASVQTPESFLNVAKIIIEKKKIYKKILVVVSAMGDTTDELLSLAHQVHPNPPHRELDMLLSIGERMSISLLAMALARQNCEAISFTGSQTGILTTNDHADAKIIDIKPKRIIPLLEDEKIVIVAGFQGMSLAGDITTLGRGGSDTTAVAMAAALGAQRVEFFKDVKGMYDKDPKNHPNAKLLKHLSYDEALEIIQRGSQVLHERSILFAKEHNIPLRILSFQENEFESYGTEISSKNNT